MRELFSAFQVGKFNYKSRAHDICAGFLKKFYTCVHRTACCEQIVNNEHFFARLKNSVNILLPLILTSLNRIDVISNAMELRGFGKNKKRSWYMKRPFVKRDFITLGLGVVLLIISLTVTIRFGRFYNPFV